MTKAEVLRILEQPVKTLRAIREIEARERGLVAGMLPGGVAYDRDRVQQGSQSDRLAKYAEKAEKLWREEDRLREQYFADVEAVERLVLLLRRDTERLILVRLYLECMSAKDIAAAEHYAVSSVYGLRDRGIKKICAAAKVNKKNKE